MFLPGGCESCSNRCVSYAQDRVFHTHGAALHSDVSNMTLRMVFSDRAQSFSSVSSKIPCWVVGLDLAVPVCLEPLVWTCGSWLWELSQFKLVMFALSLGYVADVLVVTDSTAALVWWWRWSLHLVKAICLLLLRALMMLRHVCLSLVRLKGKNATGLDFAGEFFHYCLRHREAVCAPGCCMWL